MVLTLIATGGNSAFWNSIAIGGMMVLFWLTEAMPIYVTALIPLALGVPLGVLTTDDIAASYAHKFIFLFLGGFVLALAMEKWDVHKQIARSIISFVGDSKARILLGFILSTGILSMWISNTATALMMLPMATAVVSNLSQNDSSRFPLYLLLSIAYSASIGGMGTLVGSPPNTSMAGILESVYGIEISFVDWMKFGIPVSILMMAVLFFFFVFRLRNENTSDRVHVELEKKPWNRDQLRIISVFGGVVFFWILRGPITSWTGLNYGDENVAMLGAIIMFLITSRDGSKILVWKDTEKLAWGILLLFGGGFAMAKMFDVNGVIEEVAGLLENFENLALFWLLLVVVGITIFGTEIMSNTAMVSVFIPIIALFAKNAGIPITQLATPVALAASCAFMLPVGTPPNAIVFSSGQLTINQMARTGLVLNLIGTVLIAIFAYLFIR